MPRLVIAEKPSVARDLSRVLGVSNRQNGFFQGRGWLITWCIGHLVELCEPHEYNSNWKRWSLQSLPMLPYPFRLRPVSRTQGQFNIVNRLLRRKDVTSVVNACDAGREGELIFRYVYQLAGVNKPTERLWISSMTDEAISNGFNNLRPGTEYDRLWDAARCRSEADWLVGLNATRAMTLRAREVAGPGNQSPLLSVGRVQTPCLAMLVERERAIINFVPQDYWEIHAQFDAEAGLYKGVWFEMVDNPEATDKQTKQKRNKRIDDRERAEALTAQLNGATGTVISVEKKTVTERPPYLFDLTRLQRTANKRYGFSAARTLELAQSLYETHKVLTYPRTDSSFLSSDMIPKMRSTIAAVNLDAYQPFAETILGYDKLPISKRVFNDAKVSDHHAIIPTERTPQLRRLSADEGKIYDLVVRRFLASFYPNAIFERTTCITQVLEETFLTQGRVVVDRGWREVVGLPDHAGASRPKQGQSGSSSDDDEEVQGILPPLKEDDIANVEELDLQAKQTRPPPRFTEATLLSAMEGAGRMLEEEELQEAMKDSGLGTPATRASIIETLLRRNFIERQRKSLVPTDTGMQLICAIPTESLKSPELTGSWESRMSQIARGEGQVDEFQTQVRDYVCEIVDAICQARPESMSGFLAPPSPPSGGGGGGGRTTRGKKKTTKGKSTTKKTTRSTKSSSTKSSTTKSKSTTRKSTKSSGTTTTTRSTKKSTSTKKTTTRASTTKKPKTTKSASQPAEPYRSTAMVAPQPAAANEHERRHVQDNLGFCPRCHRGLMIWGKRAWGCNQWKHGCNTTVPYEMDGYTLSVRDALALLQGDDVGPIHLEAPDGSEYTGRMTMVCSPEHGFVQTKPIK